MILENEKHLELSQLLDQKRQGNDVLYQEIQNFTKMEIEDQNLEKSIEELVIKINLTK